MRAKVLPRLSKNFQNRLMKTSNDSLKKFRHPCILLKVRQKVSGKWAKNNASLLADTNPIQDHLKLKINFLACTNSILIRSCKTKIDIRLNNCFDVLKKKSLMQIFLCACTQACLKVFRFQMVLYWSITPYKYQGRIKQVKHYSNKVLCPKVGPLCVLSLHEYY